VSERIADPQAVCPFVALDDDRDHRAPGPDHRHRCFAESPAAPRALAHQAAYCMSGSFASCPTFVDWARREAAPVKAEAAARSPRDAVPPRAAAAPPSGRAAARPGAGASDWSAPPPWGSAAGPAPAGGTGALAARGTGTAAAAGASTAGGGGSAVFAQDDLAEAGPAEPDDAAMEPAGTAGPVDVDAVPQGPDDTPAFLVGRSTRPAPTPTSAAIPAPIPAWDDGEPWNATGDDLDLPEGEPVRVPVAAPRRMPVGYAPVAASKGDRRAGGSRSGRGDASAPSWEEPRHIEEYPALKSRGGAGIPRIALYALVVLLVGAGLFIAPSLLKGIGGGGEHASPTPVPSAPVGATAVPSPTPVPTPEQVVHVVKSGESLSKIAATYGVTVDDILAANPSITNPNKIAVGDKIVIPQPLPSEIVNAEITPAPSTAP
jgi:LysM repeat protein